MVGSAERKGRGDLRSVERKSHGKEGGSDEKLVMGVEEISGGVRNGVL